MGASIIGNLLLDLWPKASNDANDEQGCDNHQNGAIKYAHMVYDHLDVCITVPEWV